MACLYAEPLMSVGVQTGSLVTFGARIGHLFAGFRKGHLVIVAAAVVRTGHLLYIVSFGTDISSMQVSLPDSFPRVCWRPDCTSHS